MSLVSRTLHRAVLRVRLRSSRHAFYLSPTGDAVESTAQTLAITYNSTRAKWYRSLTLVIQSGGYSPRLAARALNRAGLLISRCTELTSLTLFIGKGLETLQEDAAGDRLATHLFAALGNLRQFTLCLDSTEGPGHFNVLASLATIGWAKGPELRSLTLRGWRDPATSVYRGDTSYLEPWMAQKSPAKKGGVTTQLTLKDCYLSPAALRFLLQLFADSLSDLFIGWSAHCSQCSLDITVADIFTAIDRHARVRHITIRDLRPNLPSFTTPTIAPSDATRVTLPTGERFNSPIHAGPAIRTFVLELALNEFHPHLLTRFALPSLQRLSLIAGSSKTTVASSTAGMLAHRIATDLLRALDSPAFIGLVFFQLSGFPFALQMAGLLHEAFRARKIELVIEA